MDRPVHNILIAADRLGEWEFPSDNKENLWPAIDALLPELESITGYELDIDRNVQDASFLTDVGLLDSRYYDRVKKSGAIYYIFSFRFSNFGHLFTLHGGEWEQRFEELNLSKCIDKICSSGFVYVHEDNLDSPYDGINGRESPICGSPLTWWIRFFDYI
jgi:hypothetical protein